MKPTAHQTNKAKAATALRSRTAADTNPRLRRRPLYRELLAQACARCFMCVGLPMDIPAFK